LGYGHQVAVALIVPVGFQDVPRPADLPDYERPPIDEVAIGVQFAAPIPGFVDAHTGVFWQRVQNAYPKADAQPRIELPPGALQPIGATPSPFPLDIQKLLGSPHGGRTFLVSDDDAYLLQIQNDRFYRNWRRRDAPYPHFDDLAEEFRAHYASFRAFLDDERLSAPPVRHVEVSYINWITDLAMTEFLKPGGPVTLKVIGVDERPQDQTWTARYVVRDAHSQPTAHLIAQCVPAVRPGEPAPMPGSQMSLTFLMPWTESPTETALEDILAMGRNVIVRSFTDLTTPAAHEHWGRTQ
jgi:uncharacterized protein (TIGR04255 family)